MVLEKAVPDLRDKILLIFDPDADVVAKCNIDFN